MTTEGSKTASSQNAIRIPALVRERDLESANGSVARDELDICMHGSFFSFTKLMPVRFQSSYF